MRCRSGRCANAGPRPGSTPGVSVLRPDQYDGFLAVADPALTHTEEEPRLVAHLVQTAPVLPGPAECLSRGLTSPFEPVDGDEGTTSLGSRSFTNASNSWTSSISPSRHPRLDVDPREGNFYVIIPEIF